MSGQPLPPSWAPGTGLGTFGLLTRAADPILKNTTPDLQVRGSGPEGLQISPGAWETGNRGAHPQLSPVPGALSPPAACRIAPGRSCLPFPAQTPQIWRGGRAEILQTARRGHQPTGNAGQAWDSGGLAG